LALLDKYSECFSEKPGLVTVNQHELDVSADCKPRKLKVSYILDDLKPLVAARIQELLRLSSVHPQRVRGGPQECVFWGGVSIE